MKPRRAWARTAALLWAALLAVGCAPPATLRPLAGLPENKSWEVGGAFAGVGPRPYATESFHYAGQAWGTVRATKSLELSAITAFDLHAFALGGAAQLECVHASHFSLGGAVELGYLWTALAIPASVRIVDQLRLYTAPRIGSYGRYWTPGIPVGLSVPLPAGFALRGEGQVSWADFKYYNRRWLFAAALVYQVP